MVADLSNPAHAVPDMLAPPDLFAEAMSRLGVGTTRWWWPTTTWECRSGRRDCGGRCLTTDTRTCGCWTVGSESGWHRPSRSRSTYTSRAPNDSQLAHGPAGWPPRPMCSPHYQTSRRSWSTASMPNSLKAEVIATSGVCVLGTFPVRATSPIWPTSILCLQRPPLPSARACSPAEDRSSSLRPTCCAGSIRQQASSQPIESSPTAAEGMRVPAACWHCAR